MSFQVKLDELVDCLRLMNEPELVKLYGGKIEAIGDEMAAIIATKLNVEAGKTSNEESEFAGTCTPFFPSFEGQECPYPLNLMDTISEWDESEDGLGWPTPGEGGR